MSKTKVSKTYDEINARIKAGEAIVVTAEEMVDVVAEKGAKGAAASAEAADVVLLVDQLDRVLPAIQIARRSRSIALQSVIAGMGLSFVAMIAAALGYIAPVEGALLQEVIDVAVIFNALRALRG